MTTQTTSVDEAAEAAVAVTPQSARRPRLLYIDNLRVLLTCLVVMHHFAIGYGGPGGWFYNEAGSISALSTVLLTLFLAINQSFFMGFFFMISSYFTPGSVDRKGAMAFFLDRVKRLGIPLVFFAFVLLPLTVYPLSRLQGSTSPFGPFLLGFYGNPRNYEFGPLWFVAMLLIFSTAYLLVRAAFGPVGEAQASGPAAPSHASIAIFALVLGLATFLVRVWIPVGVGVPLLGLQPAHAVQYAALFGVGVVAYRRNWFATLPDRHAVFWSRIILGLVVIFPILFIAMGALEGNIEPALGGLHWQSLAYSIWEQVMCLATVVTLLVVFRNRLNTQGPLVRAMSGAAYATYIFHATVIVLLALALRGIRIDMGLKWLLLAPVAVSLSFAVGYIVKRLPLARDIV